MNNRRSFLATLALALPAAADAQNPLKDFKDAEPPPDETDWSRTGLEMSDPTRLGLLVEILNPGAKVEDLSDKGIQALVAEQVREAGVKITGTGRTRDAEAYLYIVISFYQNAFNISVRFRRPAKFLARGITLQALATTWQEGLTGTFGSSPEFITQKTLDLVDKFLGDFTSVNDLN